ncbi:hypothetical protein Pmani_008319 [Petrolisthes manimaculis]|uniref:Secreted protein n=1 Tax=Petrolisthes manimaculis TaxID=1843537 RepID=A0AAE1Q938_9EUCA|nr:hypothetical protein Pmani_008319 [Petrolisthes manimaculis]
MKLRLLKRLVIQTCFAVSLLVAESHFVKSASCTPSEFGGWATDGFTQRPLAADGDGRGQGFEATLLGRKHNIQLARRRGKKYRKQRR